MFKIISLELELLGNISFLVYVFRCSWNVLVVIKTTCKHIYSLRVEIKIKWNLYDTWIEIEHILYFKDERVCGEKFLLLIAWKMFDIVIEYIYVLSYKKCQVNLNLVWRQFVIMIEIVIEW